jgi:hypothetical protein
MKVYIAQYESRNFDFAAYGDTPMNATKALIKGFYEHIRQTGANSHFWDDEDIVVQEVELGHSYRDRELLV